MRKGLRVDDLIAEYLPVSRDTIYRMCREGKLPHVKVGRNLIFYRTEIELFLSGHSHQVKAD